MEIVKDILYLFITAAVPVLVTYLCKFLYVKWTEGKVKIENEHISTVLEQVVSMVCNCVQKTTQTFVDELKKKGEFTEEAAKEAFKMTKDTAISMLSLEAADIITNVYGDVDIYLDTLIEALVKQLKD
jgi:hypothetical protein